MRPVVGIGVRTPEKHRTYEDFVRKHVGICRNIEARYHWGYAYAEMNAGPGTAWLEIGGELYVGSPSRAIPPILESFKKPNILLCERDHNVYCDLQRTVHNAGWASAVSVREGDYATIIPEWIASLPPRSTPLGLLFHDPNGVPDLNHLAAISRHPRMARMDFVVYFSATRYKRIKAAFGKLKNLTDAVDGINKKRWLIRRPDESDPHQWTFLIGTNWPGFPEWATRGFAYLDSEEGRKILDLIAFTEDERRRRFQTTLEWDHLWETHLTGPTPNI